MATIALYAGKLNQMPSLIGEVKQSVNDYASELFSLKSKALNIRKSVCDLDDVIEQVQTSTQLQEQKAESLEAFSQKIEEFTAEVVRIDEEVASVINQRKEEFYNAYNYLKPDCEKNLWEKICDGLASAAEWCKEHWESICNVILVIVAVAISIATLGWVPAAVGALVGVISQLLSDIISLAITGEWEWYGEDYVGSALGGALGGALMGSGVGVFIASAVDGATSTLFGESLKNLTGSSNKTNSEIWTETGISAVISGIIGKISEPLAKAVGKSLSSAFPGLSRLSGIGSYAAAYKMVLTKLKKESIENISLKTIRNGFISEMWEELFETLIEKLYEMW